MTEAHREVLPLVRFQPKFYTQGVKYVDLPSPPRLPPLPDWPGPPELEYRLYRIMSPNWNGIIKVRKILLDEFGERRAIPFTVWGHILQEHGPDWYPLFEKYGRHEVRKKFIESISYELVTRDVIERT